MSKKCDIMKRMKENYESRSKTFLTRRTPVIIRLDGKAFHTYTKGLNKPFDEGLIEDMQLTAIYLCEQIQGAKCAYVQSDEISILITDYDNLQTNAWFDYNVQKMCSISASLAASKFNHLRLIREMRDWDEGVRETDLLERFVYLSTLANFDSRAFNIPKEEVANYFLARQKDAVKNSIAMLAQSLYSHKILHKKNQSEMQEMCFQKGHNWNDLHFSKKRGSFIVKNTYVNDKLAYQDKDEYEIGDIWYQPELNRLLEWAKVDYFENSDEDWVDVEIEKIRTKWEVVETPITFNTQTFKKLINA